MHPKYAIKIQKSHIELINMLNQGVAVDVQKGTNYFIVDTDPTGTNEIVTERELAQRYDIAANNPFVVKLKKAS